LLEARGKQPNIAPEFVEALTEKLGLPFDPAAHRGIHTQSSSASSAVKSSWNPEDMFCYAYAVFHSPTYRERYAEFLKIDFPRLPLTSDKELFFKLAELGEELVLLHLMRSGALDDFITRFPHSGSNVVEKVSYKDGAVWFNTEQCFEGVEEADWNFQIGGYQMLDKWLKDRKGRTLSFDDIEHYQKIVAALHETRRLMAEIDQAIPEWPVR
ncbi:MAG: type ISP restriction/modification enzyme, partial [Mariprofundaceae bacterium]|nr:type ISP restriction/modification enzyme [Mariprofundaceae bacterium]